MTLFNFTDDTKMTYKVDATEETLPTALGNGTYKGEECNVGFTSGFPKELDSGQKATEQLNMANWRESRKRIHRWFD